MDPAFLKLCRVVRQRSLPTGYLDLVFLTLSGDSSALGSNQLFGSSLSQSQARLVTPKHLSASAESSALPRQQSAGSGGHAFSVKSSLEEPVAEMKLGATEGRETTKEEQPDFFSLAQTKEMSPKEKRKQFFTFVMN